MEVLPSPKGSQAKPRRGAGLNTWLVMQLLGMPFTPHCCSPLVIRGSRLPRLIGMAEQGLAFEPGGGSQVEGGPLSRTPVKGSTVVWAASDLLYTDGTQLWTLLYFSCQFP